MYSMLLVSAKRLRRWIYTLLAKISLGNTRSDLIANGFTRLTRNTTVGNGCHFNGLIVMGQGKVNIGNCFHSGFGCKILTQNHNFHGDALPYDSSYIIKNVNIGHYVWLGIDVTVLPGVKIGDGVIVQAGAVVVSDLPDLSIAGGNPAKPFGVRDATHFEALSGLGGTEQ